MGNEHEQESQAIRSRIEYEALHESPGKHIGLEAANALTGVANSRITKPAENLGKLIRERIIRPTATNFLREMTLDALGIKSEQAIPDHNVRSSIITPDLGKMDIGVEWVQAHTVAILEWEKLLSEQRLSVLGQDGSVTLAEIDINRAGIDDKGNAMLFSQRFAYWYDSSAENPEKIYRKQPDETESKRDTTSLDINLLVELIYNLGHCKPAD